MKSLLAIIFIAICLYLLSKVPPQTTAVQPVYPTLYDVTLECQRLNAMSIDKFRIDEVNGKKNKMVFGYDSCIKELTNALKQSKGYLAL